jgi:sugar phosphate isomerase/epimerase
MGITIDFCHALATGVVQSLLETYHDQLCNVHMSNRAHKPFSEETSDLADFIARLKHYRYEGPVTLELSRKCKIEEILMTKAVLERALSID